MNLYRDKSVPRQEEEVLKRFSYPNQVSCSVVGGHLVRNARFLDIGAGTNTELGTLVKQHGGVYTPVDIWPAALNAQRKAGFSPLKLRANDLRGVKDKSIGLTHMRFVLMHLLDTEERRKSIEEALRVGRRAAFLEYDWQEGGSWSEAEVFQLFRQLGLQFLQGRADPYYGSKLEAEVREVLERLNLTSMYNVTRQEHTSGPLTDFTEPVDRCRAILEHAKVEGNTKLQNSAENILKALKEAWLSANPPSFTRPLIVSVFVEPSS